eukprot:Gregarina_sp_Pseudo_9__1291@NODE_185_length_3754_cov_15_688829_g170_i0_p2_GENE_NODE_185_length_3754_cov_15_688829_g170_i0NODE_185_length_3754_cov_15_688829_g170_i0_p2_ORF_typecomplete_len328_score42_73GRASP55_65/PF04495_14/4_5e09GRASP55_65/PF04495_14/1_8e15PDZ_2/PF13180_6/0_074PDZ_2/PF13180_6/0_00074PDZ_6/PF17820_1/0_65PDZ_6/PF17820_1/0_064_NODE_185_length_3754_cov_15_688829_g170_i025543537
MGNASSPAVHARSRIIHIQPNSLAHKLKFEPFYDFIVSINDKLVSSDQSLGQQLTEAAKEGDPEIGIFNAARRTARRVIAPRPEWGGPVQLGATVRYLPYACVYEEGLRVLRVIDDTPAAHCGLAPATDWIIAGSDGTSISTLLDLSKMLRKSAIEKIPLGLIIYSSLTGGVREVFCTPTVNSRGDPFLGAELGTSREDKITFPTPTVSLTNSPEISPSAIQHNVAVSPTENELAESSAVPAFSPSWLNESDNGGSHEEEQKLDQFFKSLQDTSSFYDKLLSKQLDPGRKFQLSGIFPIIFDCDQITNRGFETKGVSVPYFAVSNEG